MAHMEYDFDFSEYLVQKWIFRYRTNENGDI